MGLAAGSRRISDEEFGQVHRAVLSALGIDLSAYRTAQLERRLRFFARRHGLPSVGDLARALGGDADLQAALADYLTINVSEFYRDPARFDILKSRILPDLLARRASLRIWSAGVSIGAEAYTIAMILSELAPGRNHMILGTDIDAGVLAAAREARYSDNALKSLPDAYRRKYFTVEDGVYVLNPPIKSMVTFRRHDLLQDPYPRDMDLIVCRNVMIYFREERKDGIYQGFRDSLRPEGVLFIGATETILYPARYGLEAITPGFYRRLPGIE